MARQCVVLITNTQRSQIKELVLTILEQLKIHSLPILLGMITQYLGIRSLTVDEARAAGISDNIVGTAQALKTATGFVIIYDEKIPLAEARWSIAHELGHILLNHLTNSEGIDQIMEAEADYFAGQLLMPTPILDYLGYRTSEQISYTCLVARETADYRAKDLKQRKKYKSQRLLYDEMFLRQFDLEASAELAVF